jgi:ComF family protein
METAASVVSVAYEYVVALLAPPHCAACDAPVAVLAAFCAGCASTVERAPAPADGRGLTAALVYDGAVARAVVRMKYGRRPDLSRPLGDMLWRALAPRAASLGAVVVVPVPLHPVRLAERGYNQSALIARRIARRLGVPLRPLALARVRDTPQQAILERDERLTNVVGAFQARKARQVAGRAVLLVDDVCTTGATLRAAGHALFEAGARSVTSAVVAYTPGRQAEGRQTAEDEGDDSSSPTLPWSRATLRR